MLKVLFNLHITIVLCFWEIHTSPHESNVQHRFAAMYLSITKRKWHFLVWENGMWVNITQEVDSLESEGEGLENIIIQ